MKKTLGLLLAAGLMAVALTGCTTFASVTNPINETEVYTVTNAYGVAQSAAVAYVSLAYCASPVVEPCRSPGVARKLATADKDARTALTALESFARNPANYPGLSFSQLFAAARSAVSVFQQIEANNGVQSNG